MVAWTALTVPYLPTADGQSPPSLFLQIRPVRPRKSRQRYLTTVPTKLVVAPMAVGTLVTSFHLKIDTTVINAIRANPVRMIHSPYLILCWSICCCSGIGVFLSSDPPMP